MKLQNFDNFVDDFQNQQWNLPKQSPLFSGHLSHMDILFSPDKTSCLS